MPREVFGLRARRFGGNGQGLAFKGLEVLGYGRVSEVVPEGSGADEAEVGIEGDEAGYLLAGSQSNRTIA